MPFCPRSSVRFRAPPCEGGGRRCNSCRGHQFAPVPQQPQERFRKPLFVGASPTRGSSFNGDHDVTAASRPVKAFVPVRIRLVTPISHFEPVHSHSSSSLEWFCIKLVQFAVRIRTLAHNQLHWLETGEIPLRFGAARPARKRSPKMALRNSPSRVSRRWTAVGCSELLILTNKKGKL